MTPMALLSTIYASYILRMMEGKLSMLKRSPQGLSGFYSAAEYLPTSSCLKAK